MAKFGSQAAYKVGDAVWVRGNPSWGVAHIVGQNDGKTAKYDVTPSAGSYEIQYNSGTSILEVPVNDLKPATQVEDERDKAKITRERARDDQARLEMTRLLYELQKSRPVKNEEEFMQLMFTFDALSQLRAEDYLAIRGGGQLGYAGCPRVHFSPGERVRMRKGVDRQKWGLTDSNECGTVVESEPSQAIFPVSPSQPKGITVQWDISGKRLTYVTNLEPVESAAKAAPVKVTPKTVRKFEFDD